MCRMAAYLGPELKISSLTTEPKHSIIHQSYQSKEREEPLNGDGFGIAWFSNLSPKPALFKDITPAWNNQNLISIARVTTSPCILAHVRAATVGGPLSRSNCHPFVWKRYAFMHNGTIQGYDSIRRRLASSLSDDSYNLIQGTTDSEMMFALFIDEIRQYESPSTAQLSESLIATIRKIEAIKKELKIKLPSTINVVLADGEKLIAIRYASPGSKADTLYTSQGGRFYCQNGICQFTQGNEAFLVASEPLDQLDAWTPVEQNQVIEFERNHQKSFRSIEI